MMMMRGCVLVLKTYKRIESEVVVTMKYMRFLSLRFYRFEVYGKNSTLSWLPRDI